MKKLVKIGWSLCACIAIIALLATVSCKKKSNIPPAVNGTLSFGQYMPMSSMGNVEILVTSTDGFQWPAGGSAKYYGVDAQAFDYDIQVPSTGDYTVAVSAYTVDCGNSLTSVLSNTGQQVSSISYFNWTASVNSGATFVTIISTTPGPSGGVVLERTDQACCSAKINYLMCANDKSCIPYYPVNADPTYTGLCGPTYEHPCESGETDDVNGKCGILCSGASDCPSGSGWSCNYVPGATYLVYGTCQKTCTTTTDCSNDPDYNTSQRGCNIPPGASSGYCR
jgi:hypothetical protein